jgi:hypothetical protein
VRQAGLAEMHLRIHHAGQDVEPGAIDDLTGRDVTERPQRADAPVQDADIAGAFAVLIDDRAVPQNCVKGDRHASSQRALSRSLSRHTFRS